MYETRFGYDECNPSEGHTRFAPLKSGGGFVPTLYGADTPKAALLESVFHDVGEDQDSRLILIDDLRKRGLAYIAASSALRLVDLRDSALNQLSLNRNQLVSTSPAHYTCAQDWASYLHKKTAESNDPVHGLVWHSRQAELTRHGQEEVFILFGDRLPQKRGHFDLIGPGVRNLVEGVGRVMVERIAEELGATVFHEL